jgi:steroid delta-isomerase-like uncharacterized protein
LTPQTTSPDTNIELIRASFEQFNAGDLDACVACLAPDFVIHLAELPDPMYGRDTWRQGAEMMKHAFPDINAHIQDIFAAGDRVALRLTFRGTHSGEFQGLPATGRSIEYVSHEFYRVTDGLIAEEWICSDTATLMHQIS